MATSGTFSFTVNRDQVIRQAMLNIGKLEGLENPTNEEVNDCNLLLNMLVKQWMGRTDFAPGLKVWKRKWGYLFLDYNGSSYTVGTGGTGWTNSFTSTTTSATAASGATTISVTSATGFADTYHIGIQLDSGALQWTTVSGAPVGTTITLAAALTGQSSSGSVVYVYQTIAQQPLNIETCVLRDNNNVDTPINIMRTVQEYANLTNKVDTQNRSDPTAIYYEYQLTNSNLYTDCGASNDVTKYLVMSYMEPIQDMTNPSDNFEYPQESYLALTWGLSKQIAPMFNAPWTQLMETNYQAAVQIAGHKDAEVSTLYFQPGAEL